MRIVIMGGGVIGVTTAYFLAKEGHEVVVITPASALGQKLIGKRAGDVIALQPGVSAKVIAVQ